MLPSVLAISVFILAMSIKSGAFGQQRSSRPLDLFNGRLGLRVWYDLGIVCLGSVCEVIVRGNWLVYMSDTIECRLGGPVKGLCISEYNLELVSRKHYVYHLKISKIAAHNR